MKKNRVITLLAATALSAAMCLGLAACGEDKNDNTGNTGNGGSDAEQNTPVTNPNEVTAAQWTQIMGSASNFTIEVYGDEILRAVIKIDDNKRSQNADVYQQVIVKSDAGYTQYESVDSGSTWVKSDLEEGTLTENIEVYAQITSLLKDDFAKFTYADKTYSVGSIDLGTELLNEIEGVEVSFENGALKSMTVNVNNSSIFNIKDFGTTSISVPTNYTEEN